MAAIIVDDLRYIHLDKITDKNNFQLLPCFRRQSIDIETANISSLKRVYLRTETIEYPLLIFALFITCTFSGNRYH